MCNVTSKIAICNSSYVIVHVF